jgi:hypothetical protein
MWTASYRASALSCAHANPEPGSDVPEMDNAYVMANEIFVRLMKDNYGSNPHFFARAQPFSIYNEVDAYKKKYNPTLFLVFKAALFRIVLDSYKNQRDKRTLFELTEGNKYRGVVQEELESMKLHVQKIINGGS